MSAVFQIKIGELIGRGANGVVYSVDDARLVAQEGVCVKSFVDTAVKFINSNSAKELETEFNVLCELYSISNRAVPKPICFINQSKQIKWDRNENHNCCSDKGLPFTGLDAAQVCVISSNTNVVERPCVLMERLVETFESAEIDANIMPMMFKSIVEDLQPIWERGYVLRDISPRNFMCANNANGNAKVLKFIDAALVCKAEPGQYGAKFKGTSRYSSLANHLCDKDTLELIASYYKDDKGSGKAKTRGNKKDNSTLKGLEDALEGFLLGDVQIVNDGKMPISSSEDAARKKDYTEISGFRKKITEYVLKDSSPAPSFIDDITSILFMFTDKTNQSLLPWRDMRMLESIAYCKLRVLEQCCFGAIKSAATNQYAEYCSSFLNCIPKWQKSILEHVAPIALYEEQRCGNSLSVMAVSAVTSKISEIIDRTCAKKETQEWLSDEQLGKHANYYSTKPKWITDIEWLNKPLLFKKKLINPDSFTFTSLMNGDLKMAMSNFDDFDKRSF